MIYSIMHTTGWAQGLMSTNHYYYLLVSKMFSYIISNTRAAGKKQRLYFYSMAWIYLESAVKAGAPKNFKICSPLLLRYLQ